MQADCSPIKLNRYKELTAEISLPEIILTHCEMQGISRKPWKNMRRICIFAFLTIIWNIESNGIGAAKYLGKTYKVYNSI